MIESGLSCIVSDRDSARVGALAGQFWPCHLEYSACLVWLCALICSFDDIANKINEEGRAILPMNVLDAFLVQRFEYRELILQHRWPKFAATCIIM